MKTPHKHAELIKAWADGAEIEMYNPRVEAWVFLSQPPWSDDITFRIKPEPKPDVVRYISLWEHSGYSTRQPDSNLKVIFDRDTRKLIKAEALK